MDYSELDRYIEYFQRQLLPEGAEEFWEGQSAWFEANRTAIAEQYRSTAKSDGAAQALANAVLIHKDQGEYDNFFAKQIFEPLVKEALEICTGGGFAPQVPVRFVNSPGLDPSPAALPSTVEHVLFAGQGTFAFCNYWSKVFSTAICEVSTLPPEDRRKPEAIIATLRKGNVLADATRLAVRFAYFGSLLGFGRLEQPKEHLAVRVLLLQAMEIFVVGHEVGHMLAHEENPESSGLRPGQDHKSHELECDSLGLAISTEYGVRNNNPFAFQLVGAMLLFYALRTSEQVKSIILGEAQGISESHPSHEERFQHAVAFLQSVGARDEIMDSVMFALEIAMCIGSQVQIIAVEVKNAVTRQSASAIHD